MNRRTLAGLSGTKVVALEQAAARGDDPQTVAELHNLPVSTVLACWERMDILAGITPGEPQEVQLPQSGAPEPCGTAGGARRHYANGEKPCGPCKKAANTYQRAHRAASRARKQASCWCPPFAPDDGGCPCAGLVAGPDGQPVRREASA